ncbi:MAG: endonuclease/exonuclease/phosphatase family protein [Spirochaetota bacterium]
MDIPHPDPRRPRGLRVVTSERADTVRVVVAWGVLPVLLLVGASCAQARLTPGDAFTLVTWNTENLFDAHADGTEYDRYNPLRGEWDERSYHTKLNNAVRVIGAAAAAEDLGILVLQEVENRAVLGDLWDLLDRYQFEYAFMLDEAPGAVHNAVFSRFPIIEARTHALSTPWAEPGRLILELDIALNPEQTLVLFANHWPSRRGGAEETEASRRVAAAVIARRAHARSDDRDAAVLVVGDLNTNHDEYERVRGAYPTALLPASRAGIYGGRDHIFLTDDIAGLRSGGDSGAAHGGLVLYSPWNDGAGPGSYVFDGEWYTIDHILFGRGFAPEEALRLDTFTVVADAFMLDHRGAPIRFRVDRASGYSDHLPLAVRIVRPAQ